MNAPKSPIDENDYSAKAESALHKFLTLSLDLVCITEENGYFQQLNPSWENILGWTASEVLNQCWIELVHPDDVEVTLNIERQCLQQDLVEYENRYRHKNGSYRWLSWRVSRSEDGLCYRVAKDITATKPTRASLRECSAPSLGESLELEKLIATLSTEFIRLCSEEIDAEINRALQIIGEFVGCDRTLVVLFSDRVSGAAPDSVAVATFIESELAGAGTCAKDGKLGNLTYEWYTESVGPLPKEWPLLTAEPFPWWMAKMQRLEVIQASTLAELPPEASNERAAIASLGTKSIIAVPIASGKSAIGYISFSTVRQKKTWSEDVVALLRAVGEIFANALNRKQVESKLRESERRFRAVFNQTFQFCSILQTDGTILEDNQTARDFCQLKPEDLVDLRFWDLRCWTISPETQEQLKKAIAQAAAGNVVRYEADILAPDDTVITIDFSLKPLVDEAGLVELLIAEGRDLTERKRIETALIESEERWQLALRGNNDNIWDLNLKNNQCFHSARWREMLGYEEDEVSDYGDEWEKRVHPDDLERVKQTRQEHLAGKTPYYSAEYRIRCKDGSYKWILSRAQALWDEAGNPVRMVGSHTDISDRKRAEAERQKAYQQLTLHVDNSPLAIVEWDNEFRLQRWSKQAEKIFGWKATELLNKHPRDWRFVYDEDAQRVDNILRRLLDGTIQRTVDENRNYTKDGRIVYCEWYNSVLFDESGNWVSILSLVLDATERKQAEAALQQVMTELETRVEKRTADLVHTNEQLSVEITERQRTEAALRQSEEQFRRVFDEAPIGMALTGMDRRFFRVNQALLNMLGYSKSEFIGLTCEDITHPEDWERILPYIEQISTGEIDRFTLEKRYLKKNQEIVWGNLTLMMLRDESGEILYGLGMVEDITERRQAEAAISQSEEQFRRVFDEAPIGMSLAGLDNRYIRVNRAFFEMLGYTESELMALRFVDITHPEDLELEIPFMEQLITGERDRFTLEKRYLKKNQEIVWVNLTLIALRNQSGAILYTLAMVEDITERKQAEEALRQSEARFRAIVEDQTELICRFKADGTLTFVNDAYCRYFSKQRCELIGHSFMPLIPHEDQELLAQSFGSLSQEQPIVTCEHRVILPSGEIRWQQWTNRAVMFDEQGNLIEFQAAGRDITELKQAEAKILKALERERELSELRSGFVSLVSHEFRTPLTAIQSSAELLERYNHKLSDQKKQNHHRRIQTAVQRMTQLLEDVLTIGKAEAGKLRFTPSPMDLVAFCHDLVESLQMSAQPQHQINFVVVGDGSDTQMDEKLLGHILTNLLSNAIKYSTDGGTVQFDLVCNQESAVFRIQDSGIGIPPEDLESLFESFGRASNVGTIAGTGLGLAIVKRCVDLHGGKITVESEVGVGTTFTVTLPLKSQSSTDELAYRGEKES